jgi:GR25 family glycosyltransferase involved in LPS biosynthesis
MKQTIPIYLLTTKNSVRKKIVINRLKKLKLNFHIVYGLNAKNQNDKEILKSFYNKEKSKKNTNRNLNLFDIACSYGHLKIYKKIIEKKIITAVIMEDDCFPSKKFYDWVRVSSEATSKYDIIQFSAPDGYLHNSVIEKIDNFFNIYKSATKLTTATCYQINLKTCRFILKKTNNKVCSTADWPINFLIDNIKQYFVLPLISSVNSNHLESSTNLNLQVARIKRQKIKEKIPCYSFFSALYYLLHIPFLLTRRIDYSFYREEFLSRKIIFLKSLVINKFFDIEKINNNRSFYYYDLRTNLANSLKTNEEKLVKKKLFK